MTPRLLVRLALLCLFASCAYAANLRTAGPSAGSQRGVTVTLLDDDRILAFGSGTAAVWEPEQRQWTLPREAQQLSGRHLHTATVADKDRIVFIGGLAQGNGSTQIAALSSTVVWHPQSNTWEQGVGLLGGRFAHAAVALPDGDVLVIGGTASADRSENPFGPFLATVERIGDKTTAPRASMKQARVRHTATLLPDGRVMVTGGLGDDRSALDVVELYDPKANAWQPAASLQHARSGHTATLLADGRVLVVGGLDSTGEPVSQAEIWSDESKSWHDAGELLAPRQKHVATLLKDGTVLVSGGFGRGLDATRTLERWHPDTNEWTVAGEVPGDQRDHQAVLLSNGSVLLFGWDTYNYNSPVLVWLPDEEERQGLDAVVGASLTELADGRVLLAGGSRRQASSRSASVYDFKTDRWTAIAPMHFTRMFPRGVRLPDGRILIAGARDPYAGERMEGEFPPGEIWDPKTNRWTLTDDVSAVVEAPRTQTEFDAPDIAPDTRWVGVVGYFKAADGKTYAFRNAEVPGPNFPRLGVTWLNAQAKRWQPNTNDYVEREMPAMLALSDSEIMVAGGATAVVQIFNAATNTWRYTGYLPAPLRAPSILALRDGGVMIAGRVLGEETTVVCALWSPETSIWSECGRFTTDSPRDLRAPVLRELGAGQTLLVYGHEQARVRGTDGNWVATKLDFPQDTGWPTASENGTAYTSDIASAWSPAENRWVDATDVLMIHRHGLQSMRTPDRNWMFAGRSYLLEWKPRERILTRREVNQSTERDLDTAALLDNGCAVLWNNAGQGVFGRGWGSLLYVPRMYVRNFNDNKWTSGLDAPTAPARASAFMRKGNTLLLAGASRDLVGGGGAWQQYQVTCDKIVALSPVGSIPTQPLYLPTRPPRAPAPEAVAVSKTVDLPELTYLETWQATALGLADSARKYVKGTVFFGAIVLVLLMRLATRWGVYHVEDDGRAPGRTIDLIVIGVSIALLLAAFGLPWQTPRTLMMVLAAAVTVFAAKRLWANIDDRRNKILWGVPLGASAVVCALGIGTIIISRLAAMIDSLRDY